MLIDNILFEELLKAAATNPRLRQAFDLRTSGEDGSQRMLNALLPGTVMPIHRHRNRAESAILLKGHITWNFFDDNGKISESFDINPLEGRYGLQVPQGVWHSIIVHEPSVLFEAKDGKYEPLSEYDLLTT